MKAPKAPPPEKESGFFEGKIKESKIVNTKGLHGPSVPEPVIAMMEEAQQKGATNFDDIRAYLQGIATSTDLSAVREESGVPHNKMTDQEIRNVAKQTIVHLGRVENRIRSIQPPKMVSIPVDPWTDKTPKKGERARKNPDASTAQDRKVTLIMRELGHESSKRLQKAFSGGKFRELSRKTINQISAIGAGSRKGKLEGFKALTHTKMSDANRLIDTPHPLTDQLQPVDLSKAPLLRKRILDKEIGKASNGRLNVVKNSCGNPV